MLILLHIDIICGDGKENKSVCLCSELFPQPVVYESSIYDFFMYMETEELYLNHYFITSSLT
jgi:hypothetical protein